VGIGLAFAIPKGYVGLIWDRSSLPYRAAMKTMGGVVDAGYRGEVKVIMINLGREPYRIEAGQKIAQLLVQKVELPEICESEELDATLRGEHGFGSTGRF
jgi:dUTP pyrophosphatase